MDLRFGAADEAFRLEVRDFLETSLAGEFAAIRGRGGPGDELAMEVLGMGGGTVEGDELSPLQRLFLFSRADTIYAGTNEIQRNLIGERALHLPKEPT